MAPWFWYAVVAAVLYGAHQIFTRLASERIGDGLGGFVVEASAALSILLYLAFLWVSGRWNQKFSMPGFNYSVLTGICVGAGTIAFFLLFQKGGPLSSVPAILRRRRGHHGHRRNFVFSRAAVVAAVARRYAGDRWFIVTASLISCNRCGRHWLTTYDIQNLSCAPKSSMNCSCC